MNSMNNKKIREMFPWFKHNPEMIYMDSGATTLKPQSVLDKINEYYEKYSSNPHNIDSHLTYQVHHTVNKTKIKLANLMNCNPDEIAFCSGATEGLNWIAKGLEHLIEEGDEIVLTYGEHASNLIPWIQVAKNKKAKIIYAGQKNKMPTTEDFKKVLSKKTKIVTFAAGFNLTGSRLDEVEITKEVKAFNKNIIVSVDAVQSIQHRKVDIQKAGLDLLAISAHKMFGPTGIGAIYISKEMQKILFPQRLGGGMNFSISLDDYEMLDSIEKYEGGTPNVAGIYGWEAAIDFINEIGYDYIGEYEKEISRYAREKLSSLENVIVYEKDDYSSATLAINIKGVFAQDLASYLGNKNIIVRSGLSCAKLICHIIDVSEVVRISLYIYNNKEEIDKLYEALKEFKKEDILNGII